MASFITCECRKLNLLPFAKLAGMAEGLDYTLDLTNDQEASQEDDSIVADDSGLPTLDVQHAAVSDEQQQSDHPGDNFEAVEMQENPYGFREVGNTFGLETKKGYLPKADFSIELQNFVSANSMTGYVCKVTRDADRKSRYVHV